MSSPTNPSRAATLFDIFIYLITVGALFGFGISSLRSLITPEGVVFPFLVAVLVPVAVAVLGLLLLIRAVGLFLQILSAWWSPLIRASRLVFPTYPSVDAFVYLVGAGILLGFGFPTLSGLFTPQGFLIPTNVTSLAHAAVGLLGLYVVVQAFKILGTMLSRWAKL